MIFGRDTASPQLNADLAKGDLIGLGTACFFGLADFHA
jgi:hypothetical protein